MRALLIACLCVLGMPPEWLDFDGQRQSIHDTIAEHSNG